MIIAETFTFEEITVYHQNLIDLKSATFSLKKDGWSDNFLTDNKGNITNLLQIPTNKLIDFKNKFPNIKIYKKTISVYVSEHYIYCSKHRKNKKPLF
jgi:hypothetical protein